MNLRGVVPSIVLFSVPLTPLFSRADILSVCLGCRLTAGRSLNWLYFGTIPPVELNISDAYPRSLAATWCSRAIYLLGHREIRAEVGSSHEDDTSI